MACHRDTSVTKHADAVFGKCLEEEFGLRVFWQVFTVFLLFRLREVGFLTGQRNPELPVFVFLGIILGLCLLSGYASL